MILRVSLIVIFVLAILIIAVPFISNLLGLGYFSLASIGLGRLGVSSSNILRSEDSGKTWNEAVFSVGENETAPQSIFVLEPHPQNSTIVYLGTQGSGLWRSNDGGKKWHKVYDKSGILKPETDIYSIFVSRSNPSLIYLAGFQDKRGRVLKSVDGGKNFSEVYFTPDGSEIFDVFVNPGDPRHVIILAGNGGLFESRDGGEKWSLIQWFSISPVGFVINPSDIDEMYIAASSGKVYRTADSGKTLEEVAVISETERTSAASSGTEEDFYPVRSQTPSASADALTHRTSNGVYKQAFDPDLLNDLGGIFGQSSNLIFINPDNFYDILIGSRDGVFRSFNGGRSWQKIQTIIPPGTKIDVLSVQSLKNSIIIITGGELYLSDDGGATWKSSVIPGRPKVSEFVINPLKQEVMFAVLGK